MSLQSDKDISGLLKDMTNEGRLWVLALEEFTDMIVIVVLLVPKSTADDLFVDHRKKGVTSHSEMKIFTNACNNSYVER